MSFINTIEDDSDQVELIVRQRLEAKPGCSIVGFDQFDQAGAVTELSTQLSSNSSRIDGIIASLSDTDANVIALNSNLLTAIANTASNTVTNASLVEWPSNGCRFEFRAHVEPPSEHCRDRSRPGVQQRARERSTNGRRRQLDKGEQRRIGPLVQRDVTQQRHRAHQRCRTEHIEPFKFNKHCQ